MHYLASFPRAPQTEIDNLIKIKIKWNKVERHKQTYIHANKTHTYIRICTQTLYVCTFIVHIDHSNVIALNNNMSNI